MKHPFIVVVAEWSVASYVVKANTLSTAEPGAVQQALLICLFLDWEPLMLIAILLLTASSSVVADN